MKKLLYLIFGISLLFSIACNKDDDDPDPNPNPNPTNYDIIYLEDYSIDAVTVWQGNKLYVLEKDLNINNVLTIEPGCIIKLKSGVDIDVEDEGTLLANGTSDKPIIFTSIKDDTHGGDTNGDNALTQPAAKDWDNIYVVGSGSSFDHCEFYYGGGNSTYTLYIYDAATSITNCIFAHNEGGSGEGEDGVLTIYSEYNNVVVTDNIFYDNKKPIYTTATIDFDDSNIFHDPENPAVKNTYNGIFLSSSYYLDEHISWAETEIPFVFHSNWDVNSGASLTLAPGCIIKFTTDTNLDVDEEGTLIANGSFSKPIVFTSIKDDTHGGDTNADGALTQPAAKDWDNIYVSGSGTSFDYCQFLYGGGNSYYTLYIYDATVDINNCTFAHNEGGSGEGDDGVLTIYSEYNDVVVTDNIFYDNKKPIYTTATIDMDDSNIFHDPQEPSIKNTYNGIFLSSSYYLDEHITWAETEVPYVFHSNWDINPGATLTLGDHVVLKFRTDVNLDLEDGASCLVNHSGTGVYFTSYRDDDHGGDTNGDGNLTVPSNGDWDGIYDTEASGYCNWVNILYDSH